MITFAEIERFLSEFHVKLQVFDVVFIERDKNVKTLAELDITASGRKEILFDIRAEDYVGGPLISELAVLGPMWVFGKDIKGREVYIKIALGRPNGSAICISFHIAEYPMKYPFKEKLR